MLNPKMSIPFPGSLSSSCSLPFYGFFLPIGFELEVTHPQLGGPSGRFGSWNCSVLTQHKHWLLLFSLWISLLALHYGGVAILCSQQSMKLNSCGYCEAQFISQSCSLDGCSNSLVSTTDFLDSAAHSSVCSCSTVCFSNISFFLSLCLLRIFNSEF